MGFLALTAAASVLAGAIASVAGFGIGSLLTPVLNVRYDMKLAVAAVSVPHAVATAVRLWRLRRHIDTHVVKTFGLTSAAGGLTGALLQGFATGSTLTMIFAALLAFVGLAGLTGFSTRMRFGPTTGWVAGAVSGVLGGLVGNQGGIRTAALLGYDVPPAAFVASATAVGLLVDAARLPVYIFMEGDRLIPLAPLIGLAAAGAVAGTFGGEQVLKRMPPAIFRKLVSALVLTLGIYMFFQA